MTAKKQPNSQPQLSFEEAMAQLEAIIDKIEGGGAGLEESLKEYERGVQLLGHCQKVLAVAEQRLEELKAGRNADEGEDDPGPVARKDDLPF